MPYFIRISHILWNPYVTRKSQVGKLERRLLQRLSSRLVEASETLGRLTFRCALNIELSSFCCLDKRRDRSGGRGGAGRLFEETDSRKFTKSMILFTNWSRRERLLLLETGNRRRIARSSDLDYCWGLKH